MVVTLVPGHFQFDPEDSFQTLRLKHSLFRSLRDDPAIRHQKYALDLRNQVGKIVRNQNDPDTRSCQRTHGLAQTMAGEYVERLARFVKQQRPGLVIQSARDEDTAGFPG